MDKPTTLTPDYHMSIQKIENVGKIVWTDSTKINILIAWALGKIIKLHISFLHSISLCNSVLLFIDVLYSVMFLTHLAILFSGLHKLDGVRWIELNQD